MKRSNRHLIALAAVSLFASLLPAHAQAQTRVTPCSATTPNNAACITWSPTTTRTDGLPTNLPISYLVEQRVGTTGAWTSAGTTSLTRLYVENLAPGTYFFRGYAIEGSAQSGPTPAATFAATAPPPAPPNVPANFTIAVVIDLNHAPVYRVTQAGRRDARYADACGYIPVGKPCHGSVLFDFRGSKFRRVADADVKPWAPTCSGAAPCA